MKLDDIITLVKAGYTRDEIEQMDTQTNLHPDAVPVPAAVPEPAPEAEPERPAPQADKPAAVAAPAESPEPDNQPSLSDLMQSIAKLTSAVQANAIANSFIPGGVPKAPDAADVLGQIIRPTRQKKEV